MKPMKLINRQKTLNHRSTTLLFLCLALILSACGLVNGSSARPTLVATIALPAQNTAEAPGNGPTLPLATAATAGVPPLSFEPAATPTPGPLWVANPEDRVVLRIDPQTNTVAARIAIDGRPENVVTGEGGVWVLDRENDQVLRIDPARNLVSEAIYPPGGEVETLTTGAGSVWVGLTGRVDFENQTPVENNAALEGQEFIPPASVLRIDPATNKIIAQYSVQPVSRLLVNGSTLWVLSHSVIDTPLQVIDLANQVGMAVPLRNAPEWLPSEAIAINATGLWLFSSAHSKIFHATSDGRVQAAIPLDTRRPTGFADLVSRGEDLWAATPWGVVLRIDPRTNIIVAQSDLSAPLSSLIAGSDAMWAVSQQTATVFRLNPGDGSVVARIETGAPVQPTVIPSPTPRVVIWKPCPDAPNSRLKVGDLAYVTKDPPVPNRVRKEPNREAEVLGHITPAGSMLLIDGPQCSDGWVWWKVKNADLEGWTAEGDPETYWLVPLFK